MYKSTARRNYVAFHHYLSDKRLRDTIKDYFRNPSDFISLMRTHGCAISGSVALYFFDPAGGWAPSDMDLYVPRRRSKRVLRYLTAAGYAPLDRTHEVRPQYGTECGVANVVTLCNGTCTIDVIIAVMNAAIAPIFRFHSTTVMNYISADGFFCAYPTLTSKKRALANA
ncbi:hypothetical protein BV22DRAFT_1024126, partial [Leucogyrophana mollusca]